MLHDTSRMKHVRMHKTGLQIQLQMVLRDYTNQQALYVGEMGETSALHCF